ncbi:transmembrane protein, putative (macronuclear) [Tetrahymena thermophila SB210]|uniref:Transmembrane protein, putative n=1 Tax=Tetrahymena thermophila (strain SB210) TaxID=312017 RepID=I7LW05_TETTS|nr:transmembrane protein, putative [Tetrahymena thermophila SB210]EAS00518.1 transmembrane protein, putative [Tetrahymena thermophila SB210]|eukprot:XP_001020763.1 transmembrane protein, putative [Tetrahymena thermophila SB210]
MNSQTQNSICYCLVCYKEEHIENQVLDCSCCICFECADSWFATKIKERKYDHRVKCPNQHCPRQKEYAYEDLIRFQKANDQMLINYCQISKDISYCPNCDYKGYYENSKQSLCDEDFVCQKCNNKWSLQSREKYFFTEVKTSIQKLWSTSSCPQCHAHILKAGGCPQMNCIHQMLKNQAMQIFQIEGMQDFMQKTIDFVFRYSIYHIPIPLLAITFDNYSVLFTLPRLIFTWIAILSVILCFIQIEEFLSILTIEGFSFLFVLKFY